MTYLANQDISFGMDEMSEATEQIDDPTIVTNQTLSVLALVQVLNAFYAQTPFIGTVTNIQTLVDDDQLVGLSSPVLISANGIKRMADMVLSDDEQKEYAEIAGQVREELDRVTAGSWMKMPKNNDNYQYPLDETWTTAEIIKVTTFTKLSKPLMKGRSLRQICWRLIVNLRRLFRPSRKKSDWLAIMRLPRVIGFIRRCGRLRRRTNSDFNTETR